MSNTSPKVDVTVSGSQLQILMSEFEKQREMLLKLCETQNVLLAGAVGGMDATVLPPVAVTSPVPVPIQVPVPAAPVIAPPPVSEPAPVAAAPVVDNTAEIEKFLESAATPLTPTAPDAAPVPKPEPEQIQPPVAAADAGQDAPTDLFGYMRSLMAKAIEMPESDIDPDQNIMELGADSMTAMSLVKEVEVRYNIELPATLLFEYSTLNELVDFLREEIGDDSAQQA